MIDDAMLNTFASIYRGRTDVHGSMEGMCIKSPVTLDNYRAHLEGKTSLGVYMLMDDGTCYFAAIDQDFQDWDKAKSIKAGLEALGINATISASRSKGFHIAMFAETKFIAKDIRKICKSVLTKLGLEKCEVFPKQDMLDKKTTPYGNYINLPSFGIGRPYLSAEKEVLPLAHALIQIKRTPDENVAKALAILPPDKVVAPAPVIDPGHHKKKKHPPCVGMLLQGVTQGARDDAAFALARHYLDQSYTEDEVLALLKTWDTRNKPPINDDRILEQKLISAKKGYAFGCNSIKSGLLSPCCVGEDRCDWLTDNLKEQKKKGLIKDTTFMETDDTLYEELIKGTESMFLAYNKKTGAITTTNTIQSGAITYMPVYGAEIIDGAIILPSGVTDYGDTLQLQAAIKTHIKKYLDVQEEMVEWGAWYILMTWVADRLRTVGYFRFKGDTGVGKSRGLDVIGRLCYKPMMVSGAITPAPIYRLIRRFRGTLVLDEADFSDSTEKGEVITILNCGFEKGRPIIRCSKDDPNNIEILPCFGPKVFATRREFDDAALEARCLTTIMEESDRIDIPYILDDNFNKDEMELRNKLLLWRLHHYDKIEFNTLNNIDLEIPGKARLTGRLKQTSLPYALMFKDLPDVLYAFKLFLQDYQKELIANMAETEEGKAVIALFRLMQKNGKDYITTSMLCDELNSEMSMDIKLGRCTSLLHTLNIKTARKRHAGKIARYIKWDRKIMNKIYKRYIVDKDDFQDLFTVTDATGNEEADNLDLDF